MRGFQDRRRRSPTVTLPPGRVAAGWLATSLLLCLIVLSFSASAPAATPLASLSRPSPASTATAAAASSQVGHVASAVTDTSPTPGAPKATSASAPAGGLGTPASAGEVVESDRRDLQASKATPIAAARATAERTASSIVSKAPAKETVAPALGTVGQTVDGKVASSVIEGSTLVRGATVHTTALLAPASSAVLAAAGAAKPGGSVADRIAVPARQTSQPGSPAGGAPDGQQGRPAHESDATVAQAGPLQEAQGVPPASSSRARPSTSPTPQRALSPDASSAQRSDASRFQSPLASFLAASVGSQNGLAGESDAANTIEPSPSASPEPIPGHSPGAIGYGGAAASAGASGLSIFLLIFSLLSVGGLTAMSLLRLASEPRYPAPIALIPERPG
jgi:hypothetical protein